MAEVFVPATDGLGLLAEAAAAREGEDAELGDVRGLY
jgi:hypothetical protein